MSKSRAISCATYGTGFGCGTGCISPGVLAGSERILLFIRIFAICALIGRYSRIYASRGSRLRYLIVVPVRARILAPNVQSVGVGVTLNYTGKRFVLPCFICCSIGRQALHGDDGYLSSMKIIILSIVMLFIDRTQNTRTRTHFDSTSTSQNVVSISIMFIVSVSIRSIRIRVFINRIVSYIQTTISYQCTVHIKLRTSNIIFGKCFISLIFLTSGHVKGITTRIIAKKHGFTGFSYTIIVIVPPIENHTGFFPDS